MSIIFKTLKKLRSQELEKGKEAERLKKQRKTFSLKAMMASSRLVLFLILFVVLSGVFALFLAEQLGEEKSASPPTIRHKTDMKKEISGEVPRTTQAPVQQERVPAEDVSSIPPPPESIPVETVKTEIPALTSDTGSVTQEEEPDGKTPPPQKTDLRRKDVPVEEELHKSTVSFPESTPVSETRESKLSIPEKEPYKSKEVSGGTQYSPPGSAAVGTIKKEEGNDRCTQETAQPSEVAASSQEDIHRIQVEKNKKIEDLVKEIEQSIQTNGSAHKTNTLIRRLASLKGKHDSYVVKLRAYYHMHEGNLDAASDLLKTVLGKEKDDREAGINMAIIEIKKGELGAAKKRLYRLRDNYPHDQIIPDLLDKLE